MIKPLIILFNTFSVFLFSFFFGDSPVTLTGNFPKNIKAATEFVAEIKIDKGSVGGFAKLQLEVPQGFTVKELDSKSGSFSFASNIAKIIWTSVPSEPDFTVKFTLTTDQSVNGSKIIASKFSFVNNNVKEVIEMTPTEIIVGDVVAETPNTNTNTVVESPAIAAAVTTPTFENQAEPNSSITCSRIISKTANPNEFNVDVKIKKASIKGFAKYQEVLPIGFNARALKVNNSSFSVSDGKLKFVWVSLPAEEELEISYVLETNNKTTPDTKLEKGEFSYLENDQSKKINLPAELILSSAKEEEVAIKTEKPTEITNAIASIETSTEPTNTAAKETAKTEAETASKEIKAEVKEAISKKEGNVQYNVQIGAFKKAISSDVLAKKFKITEKINSDMNEGFNKFMVGSFNEYKLARAHRETVKQKGCRAFVVAYNGPKRITVQEALMITSQKWFK